MIQIDMPKDSGVQADYVDRAFKAADQDLKFRKKFMTREQRRAFYEARNAERSAEKRQALEHLEMVQEVRPMLPPHRRNK